jgi:hypothetical protein
MKNSAGKLVCTIQENYVGPASPLFHWREHSLLSLLFSMSLCRGAVIRSKYSSDSPTAKSMESIERVFPLEVRGVLSRRFKVGNTAGEYTE